MVAVAVAEPVGVLESRTSAARDAPVAPREMCRVVERGWRLASRADQSRDAAGHAAGQHLAGHSQPGRTGELELAAGEPPRWNTPHRCRSSGTPIQAKADTPHARRSNAATRGTTRIDGAVVVAIARYFAARAPAAMITKSAKPIIAHQAMLSVSLCHLRTSHMTQTPFRRDCPS